jgi:hypothetical protein
MGQNTDQCNLAWGIIDGIMYLMNCLTARVHRLDVLRAMRRANDTEAQRILIAGLPEALAGEVCRVELAPIIRRVTELPEPPPPARLSPGLAPIIAGALGRLIDIRPPGFWGFMVSVGLPNRAGVQVEGNSKVSSF